jgi:outer membrane protein TolC
MIGACTLALTFALHAQDTLQVSLEEVVTLSLGGAPDVKIAQTAVKNDYWRYQSFLADYRPQIRLTATLPNLNRSIQPITLPNGNDAFIDRALMTNSVGLRIDQDIALTGGSVFAITGLERIDGFETATNPRSISYLSTPAAIGFTQPIFGFNRLRWDKLIRPLEYEEAKRGYSEDMANVAYDAAELFFDVLIAQLNLEAAIRDKRDADTLLTISQGRFDVGRIAETELLQIELSAMNADANIASSQLNLQTSTEQLRNFLGVKQATFFLPETPDELPVFDIDVDQALSLARRHRSESVQFERQLKEAERQVAQAKGQTGPSLTVSGFIGLSQTANDFGDAYVDPLNQERLNIGLEVPIADWGKDRSEREIARSNQELTQLQVEQARINFEREIIIKVQQFSLQRNQVELAKRAYDVAQRQLSITRKRYRIGKIGITDLNISISAEASARTAYVNALRNFWLAHYDLQRITLYDFEEQQSLQLALPKVR